MAREGGFLATAVNIFIPVFWARPLWQKGPDNPQGAEAGGVGDRSGESTIHLTSFTKPSGRLAKPCCSAESPVFMRLGNTCHQFVCDNFFVPESYV